MCVTHMNVRRTSYEPSRHTATQCNTLQHTATHCNTLQHTATQVATRAWGTCAARTTTATHCCNTHCNMLQHAATHCNTGGDSGVGRMRNAYYHCNTLQHPAATHCNTLQHTATHCNTLPRRWRLGRGAHAQRVLPLQHSAATHSATYCNTLQHTVTHCNTLEHIATQVETRAWGACAARTT